MFTFFTDRDGKYQLMSLAESAFDPLARTCQFMLTEEAHHMFIGHTGLARVTKRTVEVMNELRTDDPAAVRAAGAIDLPTIQKYINFWFSSAVDLFGSEASSNAASYFASGLKGRPNEAGYADHPRTSCKRSPRGCRCRPRRSTCGPACSMKSARELPKPSL
jgi:benzoyl-CoA 2,3-dioxygenase component B